MAQVNQVSKDTWGRLGLLLFALVNQVLTMSGKNPLTVSDSDVYLLFTLLFTAGAAIWGFWKNNNFTKNAIAAQGYLNQLKGGDVSGLPPATQPDLNVSTEAPPAVDPPVMSETETEPTPSSNSPSMEQGGI